MRHFLISIILLFASIAFGQTASEFQGHVEALAKFNGRQAGTEECNKAAAYLKTKLEEFSLPVEFQGYTYGNQKSKNIIAWIGEGPEVIVVGAHYDGQGPNNPSADDNASGCAITLELAHQFKKTPPWQSMVFIFFSGEEQGLVGSKFYVEHPMFPRKSPDIKKHVFIVNLDMVGHLKKSQQFIEAPLNLPELLEPLYLKYPFAKSITLRGKNDDSDNTSFRLKGVPFVFIHTGMHNRYHKSTDTPDSLNYDGMVEVSKYVEELIRVISVVHIPDYRLTEHLETLEYKP